MCHSFYTVVCVILYGNMCYFMRYIVMIVSTLYAFTDAYMSCNIFDIIVSYLAYSYILISFCYHFLLSLNFYFHFILIVYFYFISFYFILFYFILFYFILFVYFSTYQKRSKDSNRSTSRPVWRIVKCGRGGR